MGIVGNLPHFQYNYYYFFLVNPRFCSKLRIGKSREKENIPIFHFTLLLRY